MIRRLFTLVALASAISSPASAQILRKPDNSSAYQAMDQATGQGIKDGVGAPADATYTGTGSSTLIGVEKGSYAKIEAVRALLAAQPAGTSGAPVYQVPAALPASGVSAVTGSLASNTLSSTFTPTAGRTFYATISGTGSATVTVIYSRDSGTTWAAEATGVDGSAPITSNKVAYAGVPIRIPLVVTESGVIAALCPGSMTSGSACSGTVTGTVSFAFSQ
ncbi:hypothetical protein [Caulobacter sp. RL271]|uniref:Uncharacterized protein n=1 Tax=Caulobacter segnis TaxID=88688 RepID=A0ABY4ZWW9_9CAUL|nr:hypothetical protein [Caulobacter segnis]USQ97230.1 hypothetical protein MZV50_06725 [Caulobacter segnis]